MNTLKNIANAVLMTVALAPLSPVIALMWAAKGLHQLQQKQPSTQQTAKPNRSTMPLWEMETIVHFPATA